MTAVRNRDATEDLRREGALAGIALPAPARLEPLQGHASTRRYYRVRGAGTAWVLAVYPADGIEAVDRYVRASAWLRDAGVRVPRLDARGERALLLRDAGDTLLSAVRPGPERERLYRQAIRILARLQRHGSAAGRVNPGWALDADRLRRELAFTEEHALRGWLGATGSAGARERWFDRLAEAVAALPRVVCHRDYHARNLMVSLDRLVVIDFQDMMDGPVFYDAASLLWDNYCDLEPRPVARLLSQLRRDAPVHPVRTTVDADLPDLPGGLPPAERQAFCLVAAQRHLKALGTFGYQVTRAGNDSFAAFGPRTWGHARTALRALGWHEALEALSPLERLTA